MGHPDKAFSGAALALVDNLFTMLKKKGLLDDDDVQAIAAAAIYGLQTQGDADIKTGATVLKEMYLQK